MKKTMKRELAMKGIDNQDGQSEVDSRPTKNSSMKVKWSDGGLNAEKKEASQKKSKSPSKRSRSRWAGDSSKSLDRDIHDLLASSISKPPQRKPRFPLPRLKRSLIMEDPKETRDSRNSSQSIRQKREQDSSREPQAAPPNLPKTDLPAEESVEVAAMVTKEQR
jgi:hypothetical protein